MVTGKKVILLVGALSSLGLDTASCARLWRRDGGDRIGSSPRAFPRGRNIARAPAVIIPRNESTPIETPLPESVTVIKSVSVDIVSSSSSISAAGIQGTQAAPNGSGSDGQVAGGQGTSGQSATGAAGGGSGDVVDAGTQVVSSQIKPSLSAVGLKAGVAASSTSTEAEEYVYPGVYGAGGTLTTDYRAPTRSVAPSKNSMAPKSGSVPGPPPMEASPRPGVVGPPAAPPPDGDTGSGVGSDTGVNHGSDEPSTPEPEPEPAAEPVHGGPRPRPVVTRPTNALTNVVDVTTDLGYAPSTTTAKPFQNTTISWGNGTQTRFGSGGMFPTPSSISYCQPSDYLNSVTTITTWSVTHTSTITWRGDPKDYTPPFPPIETPPPDKLKECVEPLPPPRLTLSVCTSTGTGTKYVTCMETTSTDWNFGPVMSTHTAIPTATIVRITTDKNPAVVFSPISTPNYGVPVQPKTKDPLNNHSPTKATPTNNVPPPYNSPKSQQPGPSPNPKPNPDSNNPNPNPNPNPNNPNPPPQQQQQTTSIRKPVTVVVRPSAVIIDGNTISDQPFVSTQIVIVNDNTFTIDPTQVVGGDATVTRPVSTNGGVFVPAPTSSTLGGILVVISSDVAVVDGTQYTIGPVATTAKLSDGKQVVIGTGGVVVAGDTLAVPTLPKPTEVVVAGGELITAIGKSVVVIYGTTITYGVDGSTSTTKVGDDIITLGPSGITAPGTTLGGVLAKPGETQYALVGGVTLTQIGESVVVINEATYTVGPGSVTTTTEVSGEKVTIGPGGVTIDTMSFPWPFGASSTTVIQNLRPAPSAMTATSTGYVNGYGWDGRSSGGAANPKKSEDTAPGSLKPGLGGMGIGAAGSGIVYLVCIAIGVVIFVI